MTATWNTLRRPTTLLLAVGGGTLLVTWLTLVVDNLAVLDGAGVTEAAGSAWDAAWPWVVRVTLWCVVLWIATVEQARRGRTWLPLIGAGALMVAWTTLGAFGVWTMSYSGPSTPPLVDQIGWVVGWPGPNESDWLSWCIEEGCTKQVRPTIVTPIILAASLAITAVLAARSVTARVPSSSTRRSRAVSSAVLGAAAISCVSAAAWLGLPDWWGGDPTAGDIAVELVDSMWPVLLAAVVGLMVTGAGRIGWIAFACTVLGWTWTWLDSWWTNQEDGLIARAALGTAGALLAALVVPASRAIGSLDRDAPAVPTVPVATG